MQELIATQIFTFLDQCTSTQEGLALYMLTLNCFLMPTDFIVGSIAAWVNPSIKFESRKGINGILRKIASFLLLLVCIPLTPLVPHDAGVIALTTLYTGYAFFELKSIVENLEKAGVNVSIFREVANKYLFANSGRISKSEKVEPKDISEIIVKRDDKK